MGALPHDLAGWEMFAAMVALIGVAIGAAVLLLAGIFLLWGRFPPWWWSGDIEPMGPRTALIAATMMLGGGAIVVTIGTWVQPSSDTGKLVAATVAILIAAALIALVWRFFGRS
jgi:hypothetical protein